MKMPDITPAQIVSVVGAVIAIVVAAGVSMTPDLKVAIVGLATVLGSFIVHSDAKIRGKRADNVVAIATAKQLSAPAHKAHHPVAPPK